MNIKQFQIKLKQLGYNYGEDAAENALVGYNIAIQEYDKLLKSLHEFKNTKDTFEQECG